MTKLFRFRIRVLVSCGLIVVGVAIASFSLVQYFSLSNGSPWEKSGQRGKSVLATSKANAIVYANEERPKKGEHFANLVLPRLARQVPVIEGTGEDELARGVGHVIASVLPGEPDNTVLSGHRDTVFQRLDELKVGDPIYVSTQKGTFHYVVQKTWVTTAEDKRVIVPHDQAVLTLTTCYPLLYIGPAPKRYIVQAKLSDQ